MSHAHHIGGVLAALADFGLAKTAKDCFFRAAARGAGRPGMALMRGPAPTGKGSFEEDTAHFWLQDAQGRIIDPTANQYPDGYDYSQGQPADLEANLDAVISHPLFRTRSPARQAVINALWETRQKNASDTLKHTFITGVPASGKTTAAHRLERQTGTPVLHGDTIRAPRGKRPGTEELRRAIRRLKTPHIIEGVQVMGLQPHEVAGHALKIVEPTKRTIIRRLMQRGWTPATGSARYDRVGAGNLYEEMSQNLNAFKSRLAKTAAAAREFAPGIPTSRPTSRLPRITPETENRWVMAVQDHEAARAGRHFDLRLVDPDAGKAHSWAIPKARLPQPGEKLLAVQTFTHTPEYALHFGENKPETIGQGYGAGRVRMAIKAPTEIIESDNNKVRFNIYQGRDNQEYTLRRTHDDKWLLLNTTITKDRADVPQSKPKYKEVAPDAIDVTNDQQLMMAKIDGAHNTFKLEAGKPLRIFSYRPTERNTGIIEHTHRFLPGLQLRVPDRLDGLVLRGELFAADPHTGRAREAVETGAILNSGVWKSRETQQHSPLRAVIFDVARQNGENVESLPYQEKLKILRRVNQALPILELPPMAQTAREKVDLLNRIRTGQEPITREGVVLWPTEGGAPIKAKFRPEHDVYVRNIFPETGKREGLAGGFEYSWTPRGKIVGRVGTGLAHDLKQDMLENPNKYIGRVARVRAEAIYRDKNNPKKPGALRAPSFQDWHLDKNMGRLEEE